MDSNTLAALRKSIAHWQEMAKTGWEKEQPECDQCALCSLFIKYDCEGCPVYEAGHFLCDDTPYKPAYGAWVREDIEGFKLSAKKEVDFLESLLPE